MDKPMLKTHSPPSRLLISCWIGKGKIGSPQTLDFFFFYVKELFASNLALYHIFNRILQQSSSRKKFILNDNENEAV